MIQTPPVTQSSGDPYYDLNDDWSLIVASFQTQYGIRLSRDLGGMSWDEFSSYINGLGADTPLGRIVSIRSEDKTEILKEFTPEMRKIRADYRKKMAKRKSQKDVDSGLEQIKQAFLSLAK